MFVKNTKPATGHIWLLVVTLLMTVLSLIGTIFIATQYGQLPHLGWRVYLVPTLFVIGVIVEIIVYWKLRHNIRLAINAWRHCVLVCFAFSFPPIFNIAMAYFTRTLTIEQYRTTEWLFNLSGPYFFWPCIVLAHYFFYKVLVDVKAAAAEKNDNQQEGDLLSDFNV